MKKTVDINAIFTPQGCLSAEAIKGFIRGDLDPESIRRINQHIDGCELCREAVEGAPLFRDSRKYTKGLEKLDLRWRRRENSRRQLTRSTLAGLLSVAASVVVIISLFFLNQQQRRLHSQMMVSELTRGASIEKAADEFIVPVSSENETPVFHREEDERDKFISKAGAAEMGEIPVALLEETPVYARKKIGNLVIPPKHEPMTKPQLKYPFRIMAMPPPEIEYDAPKKETSGVFYFVEEMPRFNHDDIRSFNRYISKNLKYPQKAIDKNISGRVYVQFTVNETGRLIDITIIKSAHNLLNEEVIRLLKECPRWEPGKQGGRPVKVSMVMPVNFTLYQ